MFVSRNTLIYVLMDISQCFTQYWSIFFTEILNILFLIYLMMFPNKLLDVFHEINRVIFHNIFRIVFQYFSLSRIQVASPSWLEVPCRESESVTGKPEGRTGTCSKSFPK